MCSEVFNSPWPRSLFLWARFQSDSNAQSVLRLLVKRGSFPAVIRSFAAHASRGSIFKIRLLIPLGYEALPNDACPICAFTPMQKDKCAPSTSLRTTIAVFLRHAEKRYKDALAKEAKINESKSDQMQVDTVGTPQTQEASTSIGNTNGVR